MSLNHTLSFGSDAIDLEVIQTRDSCYYFLFSSCLICATDFPPMAIFSSGNSLIESRKKSFGMPVMSADMAVNRVISCCFTCWVNGPDSNVIDGI